MNYFDYTFLVLTFLWYIFYGMTILNYKNSTLYFNNFSFYYQVYVCLLLIGYFNPYINVKFTKVKRQMVFTAALMLLFSIGIQTIFSKMNLHFNFIKDKVVNY